MSIYVKQESFLVIGRSFRLGLSRSWIRVVAIEKRVVITERPEAMVEGREGCGQCDTVMGASSTVANGLGELLATRHRRGLGRSMRPWEAARWCHHHQSYGWGRRGGAEEVIEGTSETRGGATGVEEGYVARLIGYNLTRPYVKDISESLFQKKYHLMFSFI
jgi:hypothetical protein